MEILEMDAAAVNAIVKEFAERLAQNWVKVKREAAEPESGGKVRISVSIPLNFNGKTPCGELGLTVGRRASTDKSPIWVGDPDQKQLPIGGDDNPPFEPKVYQLDQTKEYVENDGIEPGSKMTAGLPPKTRKGKA